MILDIGEDGSGILGYSVDIEPAKTRAARITWVVFRRVNFRFIWGVLMDVGTESVDCLNLCGPKASCQVSNHMIELDLNGKVSVTL